MYVSEPTEQFWAATEYCFKHSKFHSQKELAIISELSSSTVNEILKKKKAYGPKTQTKIANAFGYDLIDFLSIGRELLDNDPGKSDIRFKSILAGHRDRQQVLDEQASIGNDTNNTIPIDPATRILHESLEETCISINDKQKKAIVSILRDELEKTESQTKDRIKGMLEALTGTDDDGGST